MNQHHHISARYFVNNFFLFSSPIHYFCLRRTPGEGLEMLGPLMFFDKGEEAKPLSPSILAFVLRQKFGLGVGGGGAILESTGWDFNFSRRSQTASRKERRCPRAPAGA
jgi:hypothetical protein